MSLVTFTLPKEFVYVGAAVVSTVYLLGWQTIVVERARKKADVKYPQLYAEKEEAEKSSEKMKFNCAQRAHQNTLEQLPTLYVTTLVVGTKYPVVAASALGTWVLARVLYTRGYATGNPEKRVLGAALGSLMSLPLTLAAAYVVVNACYNLSPSINNFIMRLWDQLMANTMLFMQAVCTVKMACLVAHNPFRVRYIFPLCPRTRNEDAGKYADAKI
ncbi:MAPEG-domain-containing protein, partial [Dendrothele bispora CBS 962.96]